MKIGIDLSMRSAGIVAINEKEFHFKVISLKSNDEQLLTEMGTEVLKFLARFDNIESINIEGLSFNSLSSSKDIIAGLFWHVRWILKISYPNIPINIIAVLSWRSPLFTKEDRVQIKEAKEKVKELKENIKGLSKIEKNALILENESFILLTDIKHQTYLKLPENIKSELSSLNKNNGLHDITDAYFICNHRGV